jgi:hypothetical protein
MATKLQIWNQALRLVGAQPLTALTDDVPSRYTLEEAWPDVVEDSLSRGIWNFALKSAEVTADTSATPIVGYAYAIPKPDDWLFTVTVSAFPDLNDYYFSDNGTIKDAGGFWHSDDSPLFVEYASTDLALDANLGMWSKLFCRFVAANLALDIAPRITQSTTDVQILEREVKMRLLRAKSRDARDEKESRVRPGNWVRAQRGYANRLNRERSSVGGAIVTRQGKI